MFPALGLGSIWGLMLVYLGGALGVNTFLMKGFFDTIPVDIDESARIDGAGHARIFFGLILRLATPVLTVVFFTASPAPSTSWPSPRSSCPTCKNTTLAVGLYALVSNPLDQEWGMFAAGSTDRGDPAVRPVPVHPARAGHRPDCRRRQGLIEAVHARLVSGPGALRPDTNHPQTFRDCRTRHGRNS